MESLFGAAAPAVAPAALQPVAPTERKSPGIAFLLSLLLPGTGLIYCGKKTAGITTLLFFCGAVAGMAFIPPLNMLWGAMLRAALILYAYAFLDSFYTAREHNAGMAQYIVGNNPRIAAMLNLLTNGFGYFYLGERKKGLIWFFALRIFGSAAQRAGSEPSKYMQVTAEIILAILAIDAYRLARKQMREAFPETNLDPFAAEQGLSAAVPIVLAMFCVFNYVALFAIGLSLPELKKVDQSHASITKADSRSKYANPAYGLELTVPAEWELENKEPNQFVSAKRFQGGCNEIVMGEARLPVVSANTYVQALRDQVAQERPNARWMSEKPISIDGNAGIDVSYMSKYKDIDLRQDYLVVPRGLKFVVFIETSALAFSEECTPEFEAIRKSVRLR